MLDSRISEVEPYLGSQLPSRLKHGGTFTPVPGKTLYADDDGDIRTATSTRPGNPDWSRLKFIRIPEVKRPFTISSQLLTISMQNCSGRLLVLQILTTATTTFRTGSGRPPRVDRP